MNVRHFAACLALTACSIERGKGGVPSRTTWTVDDDAHTAAGTPAFSMTRDAALPLQPGISTARARIALACSAGTPIVMRVLIPRAYAPSLPADTAHVQVKWHTNEGATSARGMWTAAARPADSIVTLQPPATVWHALRTARSISLAVAGAPRAEDLTFEVDGVNDYLPQAAAVCQLDSTTYAPRRLTPAARAPAAAAPTRRGS